MTGEPRSAGDSSGHGTTPELRASDRDRDQVVEILQIAAGDGRLAAAELDERLDAALSARTTGDLAGFHWATARTGAAVRRGQCQWWLRCCLHGRNHATAGVRRRPRRS
ncbi:DUF1707 SHOCT-like domain-containing protein [Streptomyces sp. NPDC056231]|uniref:DUF1707 SHOCT-like domain-containing protein n=1 Tax=Streptomyces sp. NPDC056231 TaxID=3345755 RepID=UPI003AAC1CDD